MRVAKTRWTREDIGRIAVMRERRLGWHQIAEAMDTTQDAVKNAWTYYWRQSLRRYERTLETV